MKIAIFVLIFCINIFSYENFEYKIKVSNKDVVIKEAVKVSVELRQREQRDILRFDFSFVMSNNYTIELLDSHDSKDEKGRTFVKSNYLLYPLKEGTFEITPKLTIKRASKEELKKFVTGSADELMYLQTRNKVIDLAPIEIKVKPIESDVELVGDFHLDTKIDKKSITSDEQVNVEYILSGEGYKPEIESVLEDIKDVDSFIDYEQFDKKLFHRIVYKYALKSDKDFTIPKISLVGYNPKAKKRYILNSPSFDIHVVNNSINNKDKQYSFSWEKYLNYLLLFLAGFFIQKLLKKLPKKSLSDDEKFIKRVKSFKSPKELLKFLLSRGNRKFSREIEQLEKIIYEGGEYNLSTIKSSVIERFSAFNEDSI